MPVANPAGRSPASLLINARGKGGGSGCGAGPPGFQAGNTCWKLRGERAEAPAKARKAHAIAKAPAPAKTQADKLADKAEAEAARTGHPADRHIANLHRAAIAADEAHRSLREKGVGGDHYLKAVDHAVKAGRDLHEATAAREAKTGEAKAARVAAAAPKPPPPPAPPDRGSPARRAKLAARLKAFREQARRAAVDPSSHTDHAPHHLGDIDQSLIHVDPSRFQYKLAQTNHDTGSVGSLAGVKKWDPELGGVIQVWKDPADGKAYVVNGHNRLELARKLGAKHIASRFIDAKDAKEARAKGALTNIAEGRGTSLDAAKFFRDTGISRRDIEDRGVPLREKVATEGMALAGLHPELFRRVIDGGLPAERGAVIGGSGLAHPQQAELIKLLDQKKGRDLSNGDIKEFVDNAHAAGTQAKAGKSLFGDDEDEVSLGLHRAKVQRAIKERLGTEKRLFGTVAKSKAAKELERGGNTINAEESGKIAENADYALGVFDQLKNSAGPIAGHLNRAAERIAAGEHPKKVHDETYHHVLGSLADALKF